MAALCHRWFKTTKLSYRFPILKLPPPLYAVLLVECYTSTSPGRSGCRQQFIGLVKQVKFPHQKWRFMMTFPTMCILPTHMTKAWVGGLDDYFLKIPYSNRVYVGKKGRYDNAFLCECSSLKGNVSCFTDEWWETLSWNWWMLWYRWVYSPPGWIGRALFLDPRHWGLYHAIIWWVPLTPNTCVLGP